jgi:hypothetical protein
MKLDFGRKVLGQIFTLKFGQIFTPTFGQIFTFNFVQIFHPQAADVYQIILD